jgi:hypothetical protein
MAGDVFRDQIKSNINHVVCPGKKLHHACPQNGMECRQEAENMGRGVLAYVSLRGNRKTKNRKSNQTKSNQNQKEASQKENQKEPQKFQRATKVRPVLVAVSPFFLCRNISRFFLLPLVLVVLCRSPLALRQAGGSGASTSGLYKRAA